jgi:pyruvate dehydrogenase E1 component alpha subunit
MGLIGGFCHLYIGQEAVVVGMQLALTQGDQVITGYRDHGHMIACGMDPKGVMAELTGRLEAAGGLRHREQPLRHGHGGETRVRPVGFLAARRVVQHPGRAG